MLGISTYSLYAYILALTVRHTRRFIGKTDILKNSSYFHKNQTFKCDISVILVCFLLMNVFCDTAGSFWRQTSTNPIIWQRSEATLSFPSHSLCFPLQSSCVPASVTTAFLALPWFGPHLCIQIKNFWLCVLRSHLWSSAKVLDLVVSSWCWLPQFKYFLSLPALALHWFALFGSGTVTTGLLTLLPWFIPDLATSNSTFGFAFTLIKLS